MMNPCSLDGSLPFFCSGHSVSGQGLGNDPDMLEAQLVLSVKFVRLSEYVHAIHPTEKQ